MEYIIVEEGGSVERLLSSGIDSHMLQIKMYSKFEGRIIFPYHVWMLNRPGMLKQ